MSDTSCLAPRFRSSACAHKRRESCCGFTLVELLISILIIGILAALLFGALQRAAAAARIAHTKSTIAKLNASLMDRWDSYRNLRLPVDAKAILQNIKSTGGSSYQYVQAQVGFGAPPPSPPPGGSMVQRRATMLNSAADPLATPYTSSVYPTSLQVAAVRLLAMRELMKFEMPSNFMDLADITAPPTPGVGWSMNTLNVLPSYPPVSVSYMAMINNAYKNGATPEQIEANQSAECLYMILTTGSTDEGFFGQQLPTKDVGDVDGDGLLEFQDAWPVASNRYTAAGNANSPINFMRWAPGFESESQPKATLPTLLEFSVTHHDYFDPLKVDVPGGSSASPRGYQLTPLIYSAGPDGDWAIINVGNMDDPYDYAGYSASKWAGTHDNAFPTGAEDDNITNHELDTRTGK